MKEFKIIPVSVPKTDSKEEIEKFIREMKDKLKARNVANWNPMSVDDDIFTEETTT